MSIFGMQTTWVEILGVIFNLLGVWLTIRKNKWCFPVGIVGVALYVVFYYDAKLYADSLLQIFYIGLLAYGWTQWSKRGNEKSFIVTTMSAQEWLVLVLFCTGSTLFIGTLFKTYTDAAVPYLDSLLTSMSLIAQWLIAKKKLENWLVWIAADILYVGLFIYNGTYPTAILYFIFILLAVTGYLKWKKNLA